MAFTSIPPVTVPSTTVVVASTSDSTPTSIWTVYKAEMRQDLVGLTYANISAATSTQFWVGVRRQGDTGSTWTAILGPTIDGGAWDRWAGRVSMSAGDEIVAYADDADIIALTPELE